MEPFLIVCLVIVVMVRWFYLKERLDRIENQVASLASTVAGMGRGALAPAQTVPREMPIPVFVHQPEPPAPFVPLAPPVAEAQPTHDWEATVGANWLNKAGVLILVFGIALALRYSFTMLGPIGRVAVSLAVSFAMLAAGAIFEPREPYRNFARGLLGGGWAALYITVYAMHAVPAARVIDDPLIGAVLLIAVAGGMIVHSLRYRSQTVTGVAYFVAFATLAITEVTSLSLLAMVPLAASLLYVSHRFSWTRMALFAVAATYATCVWRGDNGAPLWQAQTVFAIYWLLFETFDVLHEDVWLLPLNAAGFLGLSLMKWQSAAPGRLWQFLAAAALAYLVSAGMHWRSGRWQNAATLAAGLCAAAIFQKLDHQWVAGALVVEAELVYLAALRLRSPYLRWLATSLFAIEAARLLLVDISALPTAAWTPIAALDAVVFYINRGLYTADVFYGYAAAGMLALVAGHEPPERYRSVALLLAATGPFAWGWWKRLPDFRIQGYSLCAIGLAGTALQMTRLPLAVATAIGFAAALCAHWSDRFTDDERELVRLAGSAAGALAAAALVWRVVPSAPVAPIWAALALGLLAAGLRWHSYAIAALACIRCEWVNIAGADHPVLAASFVIAALFVAHLLTLRKESAGFYFSLLGTALTTLLLFDQVSGSGLTVSWGLEGVALLASGFPLRDRILRMTGLGLLFWCILKLFVWDLRQLDTLPRILSFIVLGLILVGVSWIYTRFRERLAKYL